jgi:lysyl-tRNA synthetase class 2
MQESGPNPYPNKYEVTLSIPEFIKKYESLPIGEHLQETISLAGMLETK